MSEDRLSDNINKSIFESNLDAIIVINDEDKILDANPAAQLLLGYSHDEIIKLSKLELLDTNDSRLSALLNQLTLKDKVIGKITLIKKNRLKFPAEISALLLPNKNDDEQTLITIRDITDRKMQVEKTQELSEQLQQYNEELNVSNDELLTINQDLKDSTDELELKTIKLQFANEELKNKSEELINVNKLLSESEEKYRMLFESMNESFILGELILDSYGNPYDCKFLAVNQVAASDYGMKPDQLINKKFSDLPPKMEPPYLNEIGKVATTGIPIKNKEIFNPINRKYLEIDIYSQKSGLFAVLTRDISERKKFEEDLKRQAALLNISYEAIFSWEYEDGIVSWNQGAKRLYGYDSEEAVCHISHELLKTQHPLELNKFMEILDKDKMWTGEITHTTKDGRKIIVETRQQLITDSSGKKIVIETNRDITERKKAEDRIKESQRALEESEDFYRTVGELIPYGIWINKYPEGDNIFLSQCYLDMVGMTREEHLGYGWKTSLHPDDREEYIGKWLKFLKSGLDNWEGEFRVKDKEGNYHSILSKGLPIRNKEDKIIAYGGINLDITDRKKAEGHMKELLEKEQQLTEELTVSNEELQSTTMELQESNEKLNRSLEELSKSESLLSSITNSSSDIIYVKDRQSRWIFINPALEQFIGRNADELLGKK